MSQRVVHPLWRCCHWPLLGKGRLGCPWQGSSCDWPTCIFQPSPKTCRCECLEGPPAQSQQWLSSAGKSPSVLQQCFQQWCSVSLGLSKTLQRRPKYVARASVYCNGTVRLPKTRLPRSHFNTIIHMYCFFISTACGLQLGT